MPKKSSTVSINLLPGKETSFSEKFLRWSLTFGRYIIIGTQIIVLIAFFSRFKLDRDLIDLNEHVKEKQKILATYKPLEENVNMLQARLAEIKLIETTQGSGILALPSIANFTPNEITYVSITAAGNKLTIIGEALTTADISRFAALLSSSNLFKKDSVMLEKVERKGLAEDAITFTLTAVVEAKGDTN